jgi:hypothetical protein
VANRLRHPALAGQTAKDHAAALARTTGGIKSFKKDIVVRS